MKLPEGAHTLNTARQGLILFFTGDAPRSRRARVNLAEALHEIGGGSDCWAEIDLLGDALAATKWGIFATPALVAQGPGDDISVIYGDLSEADKLREFLLMHVSPKSISDA